MAQDYISFPKDKAVWNITTYVFGDCNPLNGDNCQITTKLILKGDTLIKNMKYSKLYEVNGTNIELLNFIGGIREDSSKKVYFVGDLLFDNYVCSDEHIDSIEILLYDFGLNVGDSIKNKNFECAKEIIYEIDSVYYAEKYRKRLTIQRNNMTNDNYWIEGVGSTKGLFYPLLNWFEWDWELSCFEDNIEDWGNSKCITTNIKDKELEEYELLFYPNPLIEESILKWNNNLFHPTTITIYNLTGTRIFSNHINENEIRLRKSMFPSNDVYMIELKSEKKIFYGKIIVI